MKRLYLAFTIFISLLTISMLPNIVIATNIDTTPTEHANSSTGNSTVDSTVNNGASQVYQGTSDSVFSDEPIKKVTTEEVGNRIVNKLYDIITILQKIAKPAAIFMFIICAFYALFGIFSHGGFVMKGVWGMIIAICLYTAVVAAPEIVSYMSSWLMN